MMSGWYLRFDGGYRMNKIGSFEANTPIDSMSLKNSIDLSAGVGYKYQWLRFDVTVDRGTLSSFNANTSAAVAQPQYTAKIGSWTALANAYLDFGTWGGFTPYAGAGIGATLLQSESYNNTAITWVKNGSPQTEQTNLSWAWMAGVAFQVAPNWIIDAGFRHLDLGKVPNTRLGGNTGTDSVLKGLSSNDIRVGVRFLFD